MNSPKKSAPITAKAKKTKNKAQFLFPAEEVKYPVWLERVQKRITSRSSEATALNNWVASLAGRPSADGKPHTRDTILEELYMLTKPGFTSEAEMMRHESIAKQLSNLVPEIEAVLRAIRATGNIVVAAHRNERFPLTSLAESLDTALVQAKRALIHVTKNRARVADGNTHCLLLFIGLKNRGTPEQDAVDLALVLMQAHGYEVNALNLLSAESVYAGSLRRRAENFEKMVRREIEEAKAFWRREAESRNYAMDDLLAQLGSRSRQTK